MATNLTNSTTYFEESVQKKLIAFILQFLKHWSIWGEYFLRCIHNTSKNSKSNSKQMCFYKGVFKAGNKDCEKKTQIIFLQKHFTVLNISILTRYIIIGAGNQELGAYLDFLAKWQLTSTTKQQTDASRFQQWAIDENYTRKRSECLRTFGNTVEKFFF